MKFKFSLKNKEISLDADVEKLVEKRMEHNEKHPDKKGKYQIKQEEKRKNEEAKHKQQLTYLIIGIGFILVMITLCVVMSILGN